MNEPRKCWTCEMFVYPEEYGRPDDMTVCGYCFADKVSEVGRRPSKAFSVAAYQAREAVFIAETEIRLDEAEKRGDTKAIAIYEQFLRMLNA